MNADDDPIALHSINKDTLKIELNVVMHQTKQVHSEFIVSINLNAELLGSVRCRLIRRR
jgi:hypothetical protein